MNGIPSSCPLRSSVRKISSLLRTSTQSPTFSFRIFEFILAFETGSLQTSYLEVSRGVSMWSRSQSLNLHRRPFSPLKQVTHQVYIKCLLSHHKPKNPCVHRGQAG